MESPGLHPKEVENYLIIADRNAERLGGLVSDLLSTTTMTVDRAPTDMVQLCAESLASAAPACKKNGVVVNFDPQEALMVGVDAVRIGQVLDNLISNAVKYSPHGGALSLRVWADGNDLRCEVSDNGIGMSASEQEGIFVKFFRAGSAVDRKIPGIGLGLMISKTIIETHGGSLSFTSHQGEGTTMSFRIPACVIGAEMSSTRT